jgi:phosphomannomutase
MHSRVAALDPGIFKAYDIRGLYGSQIDGELAELIGRSFARVLAKLAGKPASALRVGLGHDMRLTAPELAARYRAGLLGEGVHVLDAGEIGTEMLYFLVGSRGLDGGLMCTASHNPKAYTGVKLVRENAVALSGDSGIQDIRREVEAELADGARRDRGESSDGSLDEVDVYREFQSAVLGFIDLDAVRSAGERPLRVVLDGGNGMAGPMAGPALERLGLDLIETCWTPDGSFPEHEPNPLLEENRRVLTARVREAGADLGIAWDGDADRCFFIDDTGESLLGKHPGSAILYDVRASWAVPDTVRRDGGTPYINRVGHAFFKARMRAEGSLFGGEVSGHYYFRDFYCADSGTIPALLVLELLVRSGKPMSELLAPYHGKYFISGEINSEVRDQEGKIEEISARFADASQSRLDGISIDYEDWHFNVRPSNTEPLLRLCLESLASPEDMVRRRDEVLALIRS